MAEDGKIVLPQYPRNDKYHEYNAISRLCRFSMPGCTPELADQIFEDLLKFMYPSQDPRRPIKDGSINYVRSGVFKPDPIRNRVDRKRLQAANITLPGHRFHSGWVLRSIVIKKDGIYVSTKGMGNGGQWTFNQAAAGVGFHRLDKNLNIYVRNKIRFKMYEIPNKP